MKCVGGRERGLHGLGMGLEPRTLGPGPPGCLGTCTLWAGSARAHRQALPFRFLDSQFSWATGLAQQTHRDRDGCYFPWSRRRQVWIPARPLPVGDTLRWTHRWGCLAEPGPE